MRIGPFTVTAAPPVDGRPPATWGRNEGADAVAYIMETGLDARLEAARARYAERRPLSAAMHRRARAVMPGGNTRSVLHFEPFPFRVASAEGC